jgi:hypothetical protein
MLANAESIGTKLSDGYISASAADSIKCEPAIIAAAALAPYIKPFHQQHLMRYIVIHSRVKRFYTLQ